MRDALNSHALMSFVAGVALATAISLAGVSLWLCVVAFWVAMAAGLLSMVARAEIEWRRQNEIEELREEISDLTEEYARHRRCLGEPDSADWWKGVKRFSRN